MVSSRDEVVLARPDGAVDAERWARETFEQLPGAARWLLVVSWRAFLRLRLASDARRRGVAGRVIGWSLSRTPSGPVGSAQARDEVVMEASSPLLRSRLVFTVDGGRLSVQTLVDPASGVGRAVWAIALPLHRVLLPLLARRAARTVGRA